MSTYEQVFENNKQWAADTRATNAEFFTELAQGQSPDFLFIGCSDSRVPPDSAMGTEPGNVFVHRNVANVVGHTDMNIQSVIAYAIEHLKVKHVVICGHTNCGGVRAAMTADDLGELNPWLRQIRDVYIRHLATLDALDDEARYRRLIELNVYEQCLNILETSSMQRALREGFAPSVHGWIYELETGHLVDLEFDFSDDIEDIMRFYKLNA